MSAFQSLAPSTVHKTQPRVNKTLVFLDAAVEAAEVLSSAVIPGAEVIKLKAEQDGIAQITATLETRTDVEALHWVSHGRSAQVQLGSIWLSMQNLTAYVEHFQQWRKSFSSTASLLIYGCEVASGAGGKAFIQQISEWLGIPVAASEDRTGNAALGGTWDLAVSTAAIPVNLAFQPVALQSYPYVFAPNIRIFDSSIDEGNSGTTSLTLTLTLDSVNPTEPITVDYQILPDSATAGSDYSDTTLTGTVTFAPNTTTQTITVDILGDTDNEASELFFVKLSNPTGGATLADDKAVGIILNDDPNPTLAISDVTINEDNSGTKMAEFTVMLSAASNQFVSVNYKTVDATATTANNDYTNATGQLVFAPGETSKTILVPVVGDAVSEANETFSITLFGATNAAISKADGIATINNDDAHPGLSISNASLTEGGNATFTVSLGAASGQTVTVDYATADGTAVSGDYVSQMGTLTFAPGETSKTITVATTDDNQYEADETFVVNLSAATNANIASGIGTATIAENDPLPAISIIDSTLTEGNSGNQTLTFTVSLSSSSSLPVSVQYAATDGTATASDTDYSLEPGTLTFAPGETSKTISVTISGDAKYETDETFTITLTNPSGGTLADGQAMGSITNDDGQPTLSISDSAGTLEGNSGNTPASFTISLSHASSETITVNYSTADETANASDYSKASGSITFNPGETSKTIDVQVKGDSIDEANETFFVNLSNATNATIADAQGNGEITDDDGVPTISIADISVDETDGSTNATFTVSLSNPASSPITVNYATADNTADSADYTSKTGTLTFTPGQTTQTFSVDITGDAQYEVDETFLINLTGVTNATIADGQAIGTITNDDPIPTLSINDVSVIEGNDGTFNASFTVSVSAASSKAITVNYATVDNTAKVSDSDYVATNGSVTFAPNETSKVINVVVQGDTKKEVDENFFIDITSSDAMVSDGRGIGTIKTDEALPKLSIADINLNEGNTGESNATFTVSLSEEFTEQVTVRYTILDITASASNGDYVYSSEMLTFNSGETSKTIPVAVKGDPLYETNETFQVVLSEAVNASIAKERATATILNDDPLPSLSVADASVIEGNTGTTELLLTVSLDAASSETVSVSYTTADGTATAIDQDYRAINGMVSFEPGETSKTILVAIPTDTKAETDESLRFNLINPTKATIAKGEALGTVTNDDALPSLSVSDLTLNEGNTATQIATFTVSLSAASGQVVTVNYETADGTATITDGDYRTTAAALSFAPGETSKTVTVEVNSDPNFETDETFTLNLRDANNATIAKATGTATITNDDQLTAVDPNNPVNNPTNPLIIGTPEADKLTGSELDNKILGGDGDDLLDGANGNDVIQGGNGDDILYGRVGSDRLDGGDGNDILYGGRNKDEVNGGQGKDRLFGGRGDDILIGSAGGDNLHGREGNDTLLGRRGNDFLGGGLGDDLLTGGLGKDRLRGGKGKDRFQFLAPPEGADTILDFTRKQDQIVVSVKGFEAGLKQGILKQNQFSLGTSASRKSDRFIYDGRNDALYFDADGVGGAKQILLATCSKATLSHQNIVVIA